MKPELDTTCTIRDSVRLRMDDKTPPLQDFDIIVGTIEMNCLASFEMTVGNKVNDGFGPIEMVIRISAKERAKLRRKTVKAHPQWKAFAKVFK